jgi:hypothetical protein
MKALMLEEITVAQNIRWYYAPSKFLIHHEVIHDLTLAHGKMKTQPITASDTFPLDGERSG